jgi:hypothetical protein
MQPISEPTGAPHSDSDDKVTVHFTLKGEEAIEFRRWCNNRALKHSVAGKALCVKGMIVVGALPSWWETRASR